MSTSSTNSEPEDTSPDEKEPEQQVQSESGCKEHEQCNLDLEEQSHCEILLDRFELLELIGLGGKGEIWCAHDLVLDRMVAVKRITAVGFKDTDVVRFQREAKAACSVDHSNVIQMLDFGVAGEQPYMVMEYVEGINLADLIQTQGAQNIAFALEIVAQTLDGIQAVHKAGIIHRDLKAENVMVLSREIKDRTARYDDIHVKILDFGIAKSMDSTADATLTKKGAIVGTPRFMSPEQAQGNEVDHRCDLYSIGCIAFELLTGFPVFLGDTAVETISMHIDSKPPTLKSKKPDVDFPADLETIIAKALAKEPSERYQSAAEMSGAMRLVQNSLPVPEVEPMFVRTNNPEMQIRIKEQVKTGRLSTFIYAGVSAIILAIVGLSAKSIVDIVVKQTQPFETPKINTDFVMTKMPKQLSSFPKFLGLSSLFIATGEKQVKERFKELLRSKTKPTRFLLARCPIKTQYIDVVVGYRPKSVELLGCTGITSEILQMIAKCDTVTTLDMDESVIPPEALAKLKTSRVAKLSLRKCNLTNEHLKEIAKLDILELNATDNKNLNERSLEILGRPPSRLKLKVWTDGWSLPKYTNQQVAKLNDKLGMFVTTEQFRVTSEWVGQLEEFDELEDEVQ